MDRRLWGSSPNHAIRSTRGRNLINRVTAYALVLMTDEYPPFSFR